MSALWRNALRQCRRFWLSALVITMGAALGVAAVLFTLGTALDVQLRSIEVQPLDEDRRLAWLSRGEPVSTDQLYDALQGLPGLAAVIVNQPFNLSRGGATGLATSIRIYGSIWHPPLLAGRFLEPRDDAADAPPVVVIGQELARRWFRGAKAVGEQIDLPPVGRLHVVGVLGVAGRITQWDTSLVLPGRLDSGRQINGFYVVAAAPAEKIALGMAVDERLQVRLPVAQFTAVQGKALAPDERAAMQALAIVTALAVLVVLVAGINGGNLALFWVLRRRREIGIRQALGASRGALLLMILSEVLLLHLLGAAAGLLLYAGVMYSRTGELSLHIGHVAVALGAGVLTSLAVGAVPAAAAIRMEPAEAMRTE